MDLIIYYDIKIIDKKKLQNDTMTHDIVTKTALYIFFFKRKR